MKIVWTKEALERLAEIEEFIAQDSADRAEKFINYLIDRGETLVSNHRIGRLVPEISNPDIREIIARNYRVVYRIKEEEIEILTVFEGHRLIRFDELEID